MATRRVTIPVGGMDESVSELSRSPERIKDVLNGRWVKQDLIEKRNGFSRVTNASNESTYTQIGYGITTLGGEEYSFHGPCRGIFSTGEEVCYMAGTHLFALNQAGTNWHVRGMISPFTGETERTFYGQTTYCCGDTARVVAGGAGVWLTIAQSVSDNVDSLGNDTYLWRLLVTGRDDDGATTLKQTELLRSTIYQGRTHSPRVVGCGSNIYAMAIRGGDNQGPYDDEGELRLWKYDATQPHTAPDVEATLFISDVHYRGYLPTSKPVDAHYNIRTYDTCGLANDEFTVVWVDATTRNINIRKYDANAATLDELAISLGDDLASVVAVCDSPLSDALYVACWIFTAASTKWALKLFSIERSALTLNWSTTLDTIAAGASEDPGFTLGVVSGPFPFYISSGTQPERIVVTYSVLDNLNQVGEDPSPGSSLARYPWETRVVSVSSSGVLTSGIRELHNTVPLSKPWLHANTGRFYMAGANFMSASSSGQNGVLGFGYSAIYDLMEGEQQQADDETIYPRLAGIYDVGTSPGFWSVAHGGLLAAQLRNGCASAVVSAGGSYTFASTSRSDNTDTSSSTDQRERFAVDLVTLDFDGVITAGVLPEGSALIGGGYLSHYDGHTAVELGFPNAPIMTTFCSVTGPGPGNPGAGPDADTYYAMAVWEYHQPSGVLHRSIPSPYEILGHQNDADLIAYDAYSYPGSHKNPYDVNAVFYRSTDTNSNYQRVQTGTQVARNTDTGPVSHRLHENIGTTLYGPVVYIQGFQLESVCPEGAAIISVGIERVWASDFYRRERVQFSKPFSPGSANEHRRVPEFHEGFQRLVPDGREVTGILEMDDRIVIFTTESIYWMAGDGPNDAGAASDYPPLTLITSDTGCLDPRSLVRTPEGIMFRGQRGIYLLRRGDTVQFAGFAVVEQTDAYPVVVAASLNPTTSEVYFACRTEDKSDGEILVFNYALSKWSRWRITGNDGNNVVPYGACMHLPRTSKNVLRGDAGYYVAGSGSAKVEIYKLNTGTYLDSSEHYVPTTVEFGWFKGAEDQGWQRVKRLIPQMTKGDGHQLTVDVYLDLSASAARTHTFTGTEVDRFPDTDFSPMLRNKAGQQKSHAYKVKITDAKDDTTTVGDHSGFSISGIVIEWAGKRGPKKVGANRRW